MNSNTTLVKVKCDSEPPKFKKPLNSNTTLVKVKYKETWVCLKVWAIQIQLLLKLNNIMKESMEELNKNSNTTLVKVK